MGEGDKIVQLGLRGSAMVLRGCGLERTKLKRAKCPNPRTCVHMSVFPCFSREMLDKMAGSMLDELSKMGHCQ